MVHVLSSYRVDPGGEDVNYLRRVGDVYIVIHNQDLLKGRVQGSSAMCYAEYGFSDIRVKFDIEADATHDEIAAVVAQSQKRSAVFDIITNPTNVHVTVG